MSLARIEKKTLAIPALAEALGVTVEQPDAFARTYIVRKGERVLHASSKSLRAMVCEAEAIPLTTETPKGHVCACGKPHRWPAYVYAHIRERLTHTCDNHIAGHKCGATTELHMLRCVPKRELFYDGRAG